MPTVNSLGQKVYQSGEALPIVPSASFQTTPQSIQSFNQSMVNAIPTNNNIPVTTVNNTVTPVTIPVNPVTTNSLAVNNNSLASNAQTLANTQIQQSNTNTPTITDLNTQRRQQIIDSIINNNSTQASDVANIQNEADLANKKLRASTLSNELTAMDKQYRDEVAQIKLNSEGKFAGGVQAELNAAQTRYENNRANASIAYNTAVGDYQAAQDTVTQKVNALKATNDNLMSTYQLLTDALKPTPEETLILQQKYQDLSNTKKTVNDTYASVLSSAVSNKAPASVLSAIDAAAHSQNATPASIYSAAGSYGVSVDDKYKMAQVAKLNAETAAAGTPAITNPDAAKYSTALSIILGSQNLTKDNKNSIINAVNNGQDPFTVVKNQAKNIMGQTESTTVTKYEAAKTALTDLQKNLAQFYAQGGSTNIFAGNYEKVINKLGDVSNPALVDLAVQIQSQLQLYRNAVSGTAYSVQEGNDIASIFPGINKTQGLNQAILSGRMKAFDSSIDGNYQSILGPTYKTLKAAQDAQSNQSNTTAPIIDTSTVQINGLTATGPWGTLTFPSQSALNAFKKDHNINI